VGVDSREPGAQEWTTVVGPVGGWIDLHLRELWRYRDLVALFVRRDFVSQYSQTILGPLWHLLQPILTTLMFTLIFGRVARLPTDGVPASLFYLCGVVAWGYFASCVSRTSTTFVANAHLFGKVWFPRLAIPVSVVISGLVGFAIQCGLLAAMVAWAAARGEVPVPGRGLLLVPLLVAQMALLALGFGIVVSSVTTRYRDLTHLVAFGVQLWMFATPVVYPASRIPERWAWLVDVNPMAPTIEAFRLLVLGVGTVEPRQLAASAAITLGVLAAGVVLFSRVEKSFMDTV
jgi:lipopolysaccharide transport system permease protein